MYNFMDVSMSTDPVLVETSMKLYNRCPWVRAHVARVRTRPCSPCSYARYSPCCSTAWSAHGLRGPVFFGTHLPTLPPHSLGLASHRGISISPGHHPALLNPIRWSFFILQPFLAALAECSAHGMMLAFFIRSIRGPLRKYDRLRYLGHRSQEEAFAKLSTYPFRGSLVRLVL